MALLPTRRTVALEGRCFVLSACQYLARADCPNVNRQTKVTLDRRPKGLSRNFDDGLPQLDGAHEPGLQEADLRPSIHLAFYEL